MLSIEQLPIKESFITTETYVILEWKSKAFMYTGKNYKNDYVFGWWFGTNENEEDIYLHFMPTKKELMALGTGQIDLKKFLLSQNRYIIKTSSLHGDIYSEYVDNNLLDYQLPLEDSFIEFDIDYIEKI